MRMNKGKQISFENSKQKNNNKVNLSDDDFKNIKHSYS